jgi:LysR family transcriptional regulator, benzoate and cis,cis-muconate-responsive activator of ben and cat genes
MESRRPLEGNFIIVVIAQEGNFIRAARKLGITQPSLTKKVQSLERSIGTKLLERTSRRVELTKAGRLFVVEATASLNHAERAWDLAQYQSQIENRPYRLGYSAYIHSVFLPTLNDLCSLLRSPDSEPSGFILESASTRDLVERVLRGRLHVALGIRPIMDEDLWVQPVGREGFSLCLPKNHALARKATVTVFDLHRELIFWMPRSTHPGFYRRVIKYIHSVGAEPIFREVRATTHALSFVAHGFGLALLPRSAARISHTGVVFKPLSDRHLGIETVLFMRRDQRYGALKDIVDGLFSRLASLKAEIN